MGELTAASADWMLERFDEPPSTPVPARWPAAMRQLVDEARRAGWRRLRVQHDIDSGGSPYYSVQLQPGGRVEWVRATWHTRGHAPDQYRLFSTLMFDVTGGYRERLSVTKLREHIAAHPGG